MDPASLDALRASDVHLRLTQLYLKSGVSIDRLDTFATGFKSVQAGAAGGLIGAGPPSIRASYERVKKLQQTIPHPDLAFTKHTAAVGTDFFASTPSVDFFTTDVHAAVMQMLRSGKIAKTDTLLHSESQRIRYSREFMFTPHVWEHSQRVVEAVREAHPEIPANAIGPVPLVVGVDDTDVNRSGGSVCPFSFTMAGLQSGVRGMEDTMRVAGFLGRFVDPSGKVRSLPADATRERQRVGQEQLVHVFNRFAEASVLTKMRPTPCMSPEVQGLPWVYVVVYITVILADHMGLVELYGCKYNRCILCTELKADMGTVKLGNDVTGKPRDEEEVHTLLAAVGDGSATDVTTARLEELGMRPVPCALRQYAWVCRAYMPAGGVGELTVPDVMHTMALGIFKYLWAGIRQLMLRQEGGSTKLVAEFCSRVALCTGYSDEGTGIFRGQLPPGMASVDMPSALQMESLMFAILGAIAGDATLIFNRVERGQVTALVESTIAMNCLFRHRHRESLPDDAAGQAEQLAAELEADMTALQRHVATFNTNLEVLRDYQTSGYRIVKTHYIAHMVQAMRRFRGLESVSTQALERFHKHVKALYKAGNHKDFLLNMTRREHLMQFTTWACEQIRPPPLMPVLLEDREDSFHLRGAIGRDKLFAAFPVARDIIAAVLPGHLQYSFPDSYPAEAAAAALDWSEVRFFSTLRLGRHNTSITVINANPLHKGRARLDVVELNSEAEEEAEGAAPMTDQQRSRMLPIALCRTFFTYSSADAMAAARAKLVADGVEPDDDAVRNSLCFFIMQDYAVSTAADEHAAQLTQYATRRLMQQDHEEEMEVDANRYGPYKVDDISTIRRKVSLLRWISQLSVAPLGEVESPLAIELRMRAAGLVSCRLA